MGVGDQRAVHRDEGHLVRRRCPVDCIHPTPDEPGFDEAEQLYIDPEECIDCDACVEACPVDAITSEDCPPEWPVLALPAPSARLSRSGCGALTPRRRAQPAGRC